MLIIDILKGRRDCLVAVVQTNGTEKHGQLCYLKGLTYYHRIKGKDENIDFDGYIGT